MNAITGIDAAQAGASLGNQAAREFTLRRSGHKAVRFTGFQLVDAQGSGDAGSMWYDLAIYRSDESAIIVELAARRRLLDEQDIFHVEVFPDLGAAAGWLESYPCGNDVPIPASLAGGDAPMAIAVLKAVQLRQRIARIQDEYHGLLPDVFDALGITDSPGATPTKPAGVEAEEAVLADD
jgi:hypothetical protein